MQLDIPTLAVISGMTFLTQVVAIVIQRRANPEAESLRWWHLGSSFWALGVVLMPLVVVPRLALLVRLTNPFVVLGAVFIYIGLCRFLKQPDHRWPLAVVVLIAITAYGYWIDVHNNLSARTAVITATLAALTLLSAAKLLRSPTPACAPRPILRPWPLPCTESSLPSGSWSCLLLHPPPATATPV